jgi:hypothetical protein
VRLSCSSRISPFTSTVILARKVTARDRRRGLIDFAGLPSEVSRHGIQGIGDVCRPRLAQRPDRRADHRCRPHAPRWRPLAIAMVTSAIPWPSNYRHLVDRAQESRCAVEGNRLMSMPISETMTLRAETLDTRSGHDQLDWGAKGPKIGCDCVSIVAWSSPFTR